MKCNTGLKWVKAFLGVLGRSRRISEYGSCQKV